MPWCPPNWLRRDGIRVNGINTGWVDTDICRVFNPAGDLEWITTEEIAKTAPYLATRAPRNMTGQFLVVFGGQVAFSK